MTKKESLELCKKLWLWLAGDNHRQKWHRTNKEYSAASIFPELAEMFCYCPCCEYTKNFTHSNIIDCEHCPLLSFWQEHVSDEPDENGKLDDHLGTNYPCENFNTPYAKWASSPSQEKSTANAMLIVEACRKELNAIKPEPEPSSSTESTE